MMSFTCQPSTSRWWGGFSFSQAPESTQTPPNDKSLIFYLHAPLRSRQGPSRPFCDFTQCEHPQGTVLLPKFKEIQLPPTPSWKIKADQRDQRYPAKTKTKLVWIQILLLIIIRGVRYGVPSFLGPPRMGSPSRETSPCLQLRCRNEQKRQQTNAERTFHNA